MDEMHFAFGVDEEFAPYAGILMTSIVLQHPGEPVTFHLAATSLKPADQARFDTFTRLYRNTRIFIYDAAPLLRALPAEGAGNVPHRLSPAMFLRFFLPELLPAEVQRVIYLDADMLCVGRLDGLWQTPLGDAVLAASYYEAAEARRHCQRLRLKGGRYFNSGCLLIPLRAWREQALTQRVLALYRERRQDFLLPDQDTLNVLLAEPGAVHELPRGCNHMCNAFCPLPPVPAPGDVLLHFVNEGKPWYHGAAEPIRTLWQTGKARSLWQDIPELEPWDVNTTFFAGKNAEARGDYREAAHYLGIAANRLLQYFLEHTGQLKK